MPMIQRRLWPVLMSLVVLAIAGCKPAAQNRNQQPASPPPAPVKTGKWVSQFRSPHSMKYAGTQLSLFSYSSISVVSADVVFVAGDIWNPKTDGRDRIGVVVRTTDGGKTWTESLIEQPGMKIPTLNALHFVSPNLGWVVGLDDKGAGVLLKTTDGGATWAVSKPKYKQAPTAIYFADENTGWMGGATALVLPSSQPGGLTGTSFSGQGPKPSGQQRKDGASKKQQPEQRLEDEDEEGGPSDILATTDGGVTWQAQRRVPTSINHFAFLDRMTGWAVGHKGAIYHTTDSGQTWNAQKSELEMSEGPLDLSSEGHLRFSIEGVHFVDRDTGFAAASAQEEDKGRMLKTTNGGQSWARTWIVEDSGVQDVFFLNLNNGWAVTERGKYIYYTEDGGRYWNSEVVEFAQDVPMQRIAAADDAHVWAVGGGAIFFRVVE